MVRGNEVECSISVLEGLELYSVVETLGQELYFNTICGRQFKMYHNQDCCESVTIEDIAGDLTDLTRGPIVCAEERSNSGYMNDGWGSETWTFYELATNKGSVTIRWYGTSNGYYSESVQFVEIVKKGD